jgi:hypothetical protein
VLAVTEDGDELLVGIETIHQAAGSITDQAVFRGLVTAHGRA